MRETLAQFTIPFLPPTVNNLYVTDGGRRVRKKEVAAAEAKAALWLMRRQLRGRSVPRDSIIELTLEIFCRCFTNDGKSVLVGDVSNRIKAAEDWTAQVIGVDDKANFDVVAKKRHYTGTPHIVITVRRISNDEAISLRVPCEQNEAREPALASSLDELSAVGLGAAIDSAKDRRAIRDRAARRKRTADDAESRDATQHALRKLHGVCRKRYIGRKRRTR